jgi:recombinational DNA repair protein RecR
MNSTKDTRIAEGMNVGVVPEIIVVITLQSALEKGKVRVN